MMMICARLNIKQTPVILICHVEFPIKTDSLIHVDLELHHHEPDLVVVMLIKLMTTTTTTMMTMATMMMIAMMNSDSSNSSGVHLLAHPTLGDREVIGR